MNKDKITLACHLFTEVVKNNFILDFLFTDSLFTCTELINMVRNITKSKTHFLGMIKNAIRKFTCNDENFTLSDLRKHLMNKQNRCSKLEETVVFTIGTLELPILPVTKNDKRLSSNNFILNSLGYLYI